MKGVILIVYFTEANQSKFSFDVYLCKWCIKKKKEKRMKCNSSQIFSCLVLITGTLVNSEQ